MSEQRFTPSEVKIIEMLASIQAAQKFTIERLDKINGSVARHEKELREQGVFLEGQRHDFVALREEVRRHGEMLGAHETALQQSRGVWRAAVIVAGIVSAAVTGVGMWVGR